MNQHASNSEIFISKEPLNPTLKKYIYCYYFHSKEQGPTKNITFYPHVNTALTIYKNSQLNFTARSATIVPDKNVDFFPCLTPIHTTARISKIQTPFYKLGVVFKPLGINHFLSKPLCDVKNHGLSYRFDYFQNSMKASIDKIFASSAMEEKVEILDSYFLSQLQALVDSKMVEIINYTNSKKNKSVTQLCEDLDLNRRTLQRLFKKHLCVTPKQYLTIAHFRKALEEYVTTEKEHNLTSLSYASNYYDQAELIKHFKKLTDNNPFKFFGQLKQFGDKKTYWTVDN